MCYELGELRIKWTFIKEYEREMKSFGISVKGFSVQDLPDIKDLNEPETKPFYNKEVKIDSTKQDSSIEMSISEKFE